MNRRWFATCFCSVLIPLSGCTTDEESTGNPDQMSEDPPEWLSGTVDCVPVYGVLELSEVRDSVKNSAEILDYSKFSNTSQMIIDFAINNQAAKTCSGKGGSEFQVLQGRITDLIPVEDRNNLPNSIAIQVESNYYYITKMRSIDAILI